MKRFVEVINLKLMSRLISCLIFQFSFVEFNTLNHSFSDKITHVSVVRKDIVAAFVIARSRNDCNRKSSASLSLDSVDEDYLIKALDKHIQSLEEKKIELFLAEKLDTQIFSGHLSLIEAFIKTAKSFVGKEEMNGSVHKMVYDLYLFIAKTIIEANMLLRFCVECRNYLKGNLS